MLFITKPKGLNAKKRSINPQRVSLVWSLMLWLVRTDVASTFCKTSGSSFIEDGDGGDNGAGAGDKDGSLESDLGGVSSPQTNKSRKFCLWANFNDIFSCFNLALEFCRNLKFY